MDSLILLLCLWDLKGWSSGTRGAASLKALTMTTKKMRSLPLAKQNAVEFWEIFLQKISLGCLHMCITKSQTSNIFYNIIYIYIWYAYSISCTPLYTHKVHTTVVDFLQPIAQKAKKVGLVKRFQHSWFRAGRGWNNGVVSSVTNWFLQLHSRCPSQKWLIPLKLTIFNRVRESSNGQWWFAILVLWKSIYYQLQIDLGKRQPASHNIRWETYMTSMAQQNTLCKNWEINWSQNQIHQIF